MASRPDFSDAKSSVASSGGASVASAPATKPTTTTTTANGPTGGVGPTQMAQSAPSVGTPVNLAPTTPGVNSLGTGGGYAGMLATAAGDQPPVTPSAAPAPSITTTASLDAAAASAAMDESRRKAAQDRERQARDQQVRAVEAQTQRQSQTDQAQMSRIGDLLEKQTVFAAQTAKNTADTVQLLRDVLRQKQENGQASTSTQPDSSTSNPTASRTTRPMQLKQEKLPVDVGFTRSNG